MSSDVLFLGVFYPSYLKGEIVKNSIRGCQFAADNLQWSIIDGLIDNDVNLELLTVPTVSTFPFGYKRPFLKSIDFSHKNIQGHSIGFLNIPFVNNPTRGLYYKIVEWCNKTVGRKHIIIYSLNPFFLRVVLKIKAKRPGLIISIIIPDLPEYMGCNKYYSLLGLRKRDLDYIYSHINSFDYFVLVSKCMIDRLNIPESKTVVVEGIYNDNIKIDIPSKESDKVILYTGNLNKRYGIKKLIDAFSLIEQENFQLWIRGNGDMLEYVIEQSQKDNRIKYIDKLSDEELRRLQRRATVLVNPISPTEEFSHYFFPSKTMDYLASATPTIMYHLTCLPPEYLDYLYIVENESTSCLAECLIDICNKDSNELKQFGSKAREYIIEHKNPRSQVMKILKLINYNNHVDF